MKKTKASRQCPSRKALMAFGSAVVVECKPFHALLNKKSLMAPLGFIMEGRERFSNEQEL
jgi:hypothetical protein